MKNETKAKETKVDTKATEEVVETKVDTKVKIMLPRARVGEDDFVFVGYNGVGYQIKRGEQTEVPEAVAKILATAEEQEIRLAELIKEASEIKELAK